MSIHHHRKPRQQMKRIPITPLELLNKNLIITDHCLKQWKDRVAPNATKEQIYNYIKRCANVRGKYSFQYQDYYFLEDETVIILERNQNNIILTSTWGRISNVPYLERIELLVRNLHKYGKINLSLSQNTFDNIN